MSRPSIEVEHRGIDKGMVVLIVYVPMECIDEQSHAYTHDQVKHITGKALADEYRTRRRELTHDSGS